MRPVVLISKDILMPNYLPTYGNTYWKTPNIDAIAKQGTVFNRHYTAAPSTAMAFTSMCTKKYPYELERTEYKHESEYIGDTIFDVFTKSGVKCHIIWSDNYMKVAKPFANCFRNAEIHTLDMNQPVGPFIDGLDPIVRDDNRGHEIVKKIYNMAKDIVSDNVFLWIHLPHVILGRCSYGDDIDLLDELIGKLRNIFDDDSFYITADHGNMNGSKGRWVYGFEVFEPAIHIPLITPRIDEAKQVDFLTSNTQLADMIINRKIEDKGYIISDSTYYQQPNRTLAIIKDNYKLIYSKLDRKFYMYDILYDRNEEVNLLDLKMYDKARHRYTNVKEVYFYPYWDEAKHAYEELLAIFDSIYREGTAIVEFKRKIKYELTQIFGRYLSYRNIKKKKNRK